MSPLALAALFLAAASPAPKAAPPQKGAPAADQAPKLPPKAPPGLFDEALSAHRGGSWVKAANLMYAFVAGSPRTDDNYEWAEYFLADALSHLGLSHGAASYYAVVARERSRPEILPDALRALEKLMEKPYDEQLVLEDLLHGTDFGYLPPEISDFVLYQQGFVDYRQGQPVWGERRFKQITAGSPYAFRAAYVRAADLVRSGKLDAAKEQLGALADEEKAPVAARNEARVALARLAYEAKQYEKAIELYDAVELPELDVGRGPQYLEMAWAHYRLGQHGRAMGLLLALDAPSFKRLFLPETHILKALIFKDLCHFLPAKRAARELSRRYRASLEAIRGRTDLSQDPLLLSAALSRGSAYRADAFLKVLLAERDRLGRYASDFAKSGLATQLGRVYELAVAEATRVRAAALEPALAEAADELLREEEQARLADYEIGMDLYRRLKRGEQLRGAALVDEPLTTREVAFPFDGEFWNDELRSYRFFLKNRCLEVQ